MKRATVTIPDDLEADLDAYMRAQEAPPSFAALVQAALRRYLAEMRLAERQYRPPLRPLSVTPAAEGSGRTDVSMAHDRELSEAE